VDRNLLRRRLREILRRDWLPEVAGRQEAVDVLVRARADAYGLSFEALRRALLSELCETAC